MKNLQERFLRYVSFDTQSDARSDSTPSSTKQLNLASQLVKELQALGLQQVEVDDFGIVYGFLSSNTKMDIQSIGFIAHMDTSPDASGANIKPRVIENYQGDDILLNKELDIVLSPSDYPILREKIGETLIVTDGSTLLGADDKAGVAEIMTLLATLVQNPSIQHGPINIAFTPDEEVGRGVEHFSREKFKAPFAFTVDGGPVHDVEFENFNAASAKVIVTGHNIHPGSAKGKMVNSITLAMEFQGLLPENEVPERTEGYEGFHHLSDISGSVEETILEYILRNHDAAKLEITKNQLLKAAESLNQKYKGSWIHVQIKDTYRNMKEHLQHHPAILDLAYDSIRATGLTPTSHPIRGGTDGAQLTYLGLPCPNLGTGGYNFHSRLEFASLTEMEQSVQVLLGIVQGVVSRGKIV